MKPIADILEDAARLIEKPGTWTQRDYARNAKGKGVEPTDPSATCFCFVGAIARAAGVSALIAERRLRGDGVLAAIGQRQPHQWNDAPARTQAEVVAKLREAATLARGDTA